MDKNSDKNIDVYGLWQVSTEGDCEGRTIKSLGLWEGFIDDIALHLADRVMYNLWITPAEVNKVTEKPMARRVDVYMNHIAHIDTTERLEIATKAFANRNVRISKSDYYGAFVINNNTSEEEILRSSALAKLTAAERKLLGL